MAEEQNQKRELTEDEIAAINKKAAIEKRIEEVATRVLNSEFAKRDADRPEQAPTSAPINPYAPVPGSIQHLFGQLLPYAAQIDAEIRDLQKQRDMLNERIGVLQHTQGQIRSLANQAL